MSTPKDTAKESENQPVAKPGKKLSGEQLDKVSGGGVSVGDGASPKIGEGEDASLRKAE